MITKIKLSNFRSFKNVELDLGHHNLLIGPNASGKSNIISFFKFLKDMVSYGLDNAISMQGGLEFFRNVSIGTSSETRIQIVSSKVEETSNGFNRIVSSIPHEENGEEYVFSVLEYIHDFSLTYPDKTNYNISNEAITIKYEISKLLEGSYASGNYKSSDETEFAELIFTNTNGKISSKVNYEPSVFNLNPSTFFDFEESIGLITSSLMVESNAFNVEKYPLNVSKFWFMILTMGINKTYHDINLYNFNNIPKESISLKGKLELEDDGRNLPIVMKRILEDKDESDKLQRLIQDILPFVKDMKIDPLSDSTLLLSIKEIFANKLLPAPLLSDGTLKVITLIIVLFFEKNNFIILEEPERSLHPSICISISDSIKEASKNKQIIVTTHSPELLKNTDINDVILVSRNKEGYTVFTKPAESKEIKIFLENELGIDKLFIDNLLGM